MNDFSKIKDENVKKAIIDFRKELNSGEQLIDFNKAVASSDGNCFKQFFADGTDIFVKTGDGTYKTSDEAVLQFNRVFRKFNTCLVINNSSITDDTKDKLQTRMDDLMKKYSEQLILENQKVAQKFFLELSFFFINFMF